jgi:hypothetical protein
MQITLTAADEIEMDITKYRRAARMRWDRQGKKKIATKSIIHHPGGMHGWLLTIVAWIINGEYKNVAW